MDLKSKTALITGSSGGIGEEFAVQFAKRGVNLVLVARRAEKLAELRNTLTERHPDLTVDVIAADLAVPGSGPDLASKVSDLGRTIDILVNNAGVGLHGKFVGQDAAANGAQIQLNCGTLVDLTACYLPAMTTAGHGVVITCVDRGFSADTRHGGLRRHKGICAVVHRGTVAGVQGNRGEGARAVPGRHGDGVLHTNRGRIPHRRQADTQTGVDTALAALDKSTPTVVSGWRNSLLATVTASLHEADWCRSPSSFESQLAGFLRRM